MKTFYITFGQVHEHDVFGQVFDKDCVAAVQAFNIDEARKTAGVLFGRHFSNVYSDRPKMDFYRRGVIKI